jgi:hypothetical protein
MVLGRFDNHLLKYSQNYTDHAHEIPNTSINTLNERAFFSLFSTRDEKKKYKV